MSHLLEELMRAGHAIERRLRDANGDASKFSRIAASELETLSVHAELSLQTIVETFLAAPRPLEELPPQYNADSPRLTPKLSLIAFRTELFFLELVLWVDPALVIHDHNFTGAFYTLLGDKLEVRYEPFVAREKVDEQLYVGDPLVVTQARRVRPGEVCEIPAAGGVHRIFHLSSPTASVVAVFMLDDDAWILQEPGIARRFDWEYQANPMGVKRLQLMQLLGGSRRSELAASARAFVVDRSPAESYLALSTLAREIGSGTEREVALFEEIVDSLRRQHGAWVNLAAQALRHESPLHAVAWSKLEDDERVLLGALLTATASPQLASLLESHLSSCYRGVDGALRLIDRIEARGGLKVPKETFLSRHLTPRLAPIARS